MVMLALLHELVQIRWCMPSVGAVGRLSVCRSAFVLCPVMALVGGLSGGGLL